MTVGNESAESESESRDEREQLEWSEVSRRDIVFEVGFTVLLVLVGGVWYWVGPGEHLVARLLSMFVFLIVFYLLMVHLLSLMQICVAALEDAFGVE